MGTIAAVALLVYAVVSKPRICGDLDYDWGYDRDLSFGLMEYACILRAGHGGAHYGQATGR